MRTHLIAVGRMKPGVERTLLEHYAARLNPAPDVREVEEKRNLPPAKLKVREGELLLAAVPEGALVVAMDEHGRQLGSRAFAKKLGQWRDEGQRDVAFLIGGADGLDKAVLERANLKLSLGEMTWPHMLVRGLLAEQLYRANAILTGHPYHRD
ncbi:23S rRNA (pseudouridine(1915)-N(3))-methyltransferase RlmH [Magnetovibrio sp. PR-2]|uniref:23S rRNA (pseudouridine(1915)-N(3))-methyltransferase RlmH n=1 Tax=Magnetovibrio sp. PR-2 TaxID=3120356 RepID=UPI002FCDEF88